MYTWTWEKQGFSDSHEGDHLFIFFIKFLFYNYFLNRRNSWLKNYGIINWNFTKPLHIKNGTLSHLMALIFWEMLSEATNKCLKITGFYNFDNCEQTFHSITLWKKTKSHHLILLLSLRKFHEWEKNCRTFTNWQAITSTTT